MRNVRSRQWFVCAITALLCLIAFFVTRGGGFLTALTPSVMAANGTPGASASYKNNGSDCTSEYHGPAFDKAVVIDTSDIECGDLTTFGGTLAIKGVVRGDIVAFNSAVVVGGEVDGNIDLYGGTLILQPGSHMNGDVHLYGGHWIQKQGILLHGTINDDTRNAGWLLSDVEGFHFSFWLLIIWVALGVVLTSLLPENVMLVRTTVISKMRRSVVIGLLSMLLAPPVLLVLIALVLSIPLAIIVGLGLIAAWGLGTVSIGWLIGEYIMRKLAPHRNTRLMQIVVGLTVLVLAGSLPYIGWLISIGVGLLGLGAVFLSRFGTRLYSQPKQPLPL